MKKKARPAREKIFRVPDTKTMEVLIVCPHTPRDGGVIASFVGEQETPTIGETFRTYGVFDNKLDVIQGKVTIVLRDPHMNRVEIVVEVESPEEILALKKAGWNKA